jgi:hypothetical protein
LERTRAFFTGQSDEPCSGTARFERAGSGAARFGPAFLGVALDGTCHLDIGNTLLRSLGG